jgi:penicillin-binding protein 2
MRRRHKRFINVWKTRLNRGYPVAGAVSTRGRQPTRLPSVPVRVAVLAAFAIALVGVLVFRLWFLQVLSAQTYLAQAQNNSLRAVEIMAPRGVIKDRNGKTLVDNRPGLAVGIRPMNVPKGELPQLIDRLSRLVHSPAATIRSLVAKQSWLPYDLVVIKRDAAKSLVAYLLEHTQAFPGVEVQQNYLRAYPMGETGASFLGYIGQIDAQQLKRHAFNGYLPDDQVGQTGVEATYDRWLQGKDGASKVEVNALGKPQAVVAGGSLPQVGDNLVLTVDARVQQAAEKAVRSGIAMAHANGFAQANAGAAVVLDAHSGAVLAMVSTPSYHPSWFSGGITAKHMARLLRPQADDPLLNRAIAGEYPTGSTFKVVDTVAGLQTGVLSPSTTLDAQGTYVNHGTTYHDWNPAGHGAIDLTQALVQSADTYFYQVGYDFYLRPGSELEGWAQRLGYGRLTGIDIPGEVAGLVPTPAWRRHTYTRKTDPSWQIDSLWKPGNSINLAIGQGDLLATPLQVAVNYAAIANGGYLVTPHLGLRVESPQGALLRRLAFPPPVNLGISGSYLAFVRNALHEAASTPAGTSYGVFGNYPLAVSGKTGTAQVAGKGDYSWYASFAPASDPKYVVVVMIEQGGHGGTAAAPAARLIYDALFNVKGSVVGGVGQGD